MSRAVAGRTENYGFRIRTASRKPQVQFFRMLGLPTPWGFVHVLGSDAAYGNGSETCFAYRGEPVRSVFVSVHAIERLNERFHEGAESHDQLLKELGCGYAFGSPRLHLSEENSDMLLLVNDMICVGEYIRDADGVSILVRTLYTRDMLSYKMLERYYAAELLSPMTQAEDLLMAA
jgi:hypothetical protein